MVKNVRSYLELLAPRGVRRVLLLHALQTAPGTSADPQATAEAAAAARNFLDLLQARLEAAGVPEVLTRLAAGHPVSVILEVLNTQDISMVLLGTQGKGFIAKISVGSVTHNISRFAPCPMLLIPPADRDSRE